MERRLNPTKDFEFQPPAAEFDLMSQLERQRSKAALCIRCHSEVSASSSSSIESGDLDIVRVDINTQSKSLDRNLESVARHLRELEMVCSQQQQRQSFFPGKVVEEDLSYGDDGAGVGQQSAVQVQSSSSSSAASTESEASSGTHVSQISSGSLIDEDDYHTAAELEASTSGEPLRRLPESQQEERSPARRITEWPVKSLSASQLKQQQESTPVPRRAASVSQLENPLKKSTTSASKEGSPNSGSSRSKGRMHLISDSVFLSKDAAESFTRSL
jgi:hypothetical protein